MVLMNQTVIISKFSVVNDSLSDSQDVIERNIIKEESKQYLSSHALSVLMQSYITVFMFHYKVSYSYDKVSFVFNSIPAARTKGVFYSLESGPQRVVTQPSPPTLQSVTAAISLTLPSCLAPNHSPMMSSHSLNSQPCR